MVVAGDRANELQFPSQAAARAIAAGIGRQMLSGVGLLGPENASSVTQNKNFDDNMLVIQKKRDLSAYKVTLMSYFADACNRISSYHDETLENINIC